MLLPTPATLYVVTPTVAVAVDFALAPVVESLTVTVNMKVPKVVYAWEPLPVNAPSPPATVAELDVESPQAIVAESADELSVVTRSDKVNDAVTLDAPVAVAVTVTASSGLHEPSLQNSFVPHEVPFATQEPGSQNASPLRHSVMPV
jgi:hypothetical protein